MEEAPRKVEHAKAPAASVDPAADLALVATARAQTLHDVSLFTRGTLILIGRLGEATERLLRERDSAARCCDSYAIENQQLSDKAEAALRERDGWMESARQFCRNAEFYHGIVTQIGGLFGIAARTSDDGSVQDDVLALKVFDLVDAALRERDELTRRLKGDVGDVFLDEIHGDV